jgi:hypothetical protein
MQEKVYLKQSIKNWLHWHTDVWDKHISLRLAGKPAFMLEKYIEKYWEDEWQKRYRELLIMLKEIGDNNRSAFVIYINNKT